MKLRQVLTMPAGAGETVKPVPLRVSQIRDISSGLRFAAWSGPAAIGGFSRKIKVVGGYPPPHWCRVLIKAWFTNPAEERRSLDRGVARSWLWQLARAHLCATAAAGGTYHGARSAGSPQDLVPAGGLVSKVQVARIGRVAPQPECLALSRRRRLPRHGILQRRFEGLAARCSYLQGHFDTPAFGRCKGSFFGMKNFGDADLALVAGRCVGLTCRACERRAYQQCRRSDDKFHDVVFPVGSEHDARVQGDPRINVNIGFCDAPQDFQTGTGRKRIPGRRLAGTKQ
jgi:hypothetical protein